MADDVAGRVDVIWEVEDIPDKDHLYMRIQRMWIDPASGEPFPGAFRLRKGEKGMSTDWDKYSSPEDSRQRAKKPEDNAIIAMQVGDVRNIPGQEVCHTPISENRAHTEITGEKTAEARLFFLRIYRMVIPLDS